MTDLKKSKEQGARSKQQRARSEQPAAGSQQQAARQQQAASSKCGDKGQVWGHKQQAASAGTQAAKTHLDGVDRLAFRRRRLRQLHCDHKAICQKRCKHHNLSLRSCNSSLRSTQTTADCVCTYPLAFGLEVRVVRKCRAAKRLARAPPLQQAPGRARGAWSPVSGRGIRPLPRLSCRESALWVSACSPHAISQTSYSCGETSYSRGETRYCGETSYSYGETSSARRQIACGLTRDPRGSAGPSGCAPAPSAAVSRGPF